MGSPLHIVAGPPACGEGANAFIEKYFHDCVYDGRDLAGFYIGLASIFCWFVAQVPQLVKNYKCKSADALSAWFLAQWLLGDTFNLLGALLKGDQLPTVVYTAQFFICMDCVLLVQYIFYSSLERRRERTFALRRHRHGHRHRRHSHRARPEWLQQEQAASEDLAAAAVDSAAGPSVPEADEAGEGVVEQQGAARAAPRAMASVATLLVLAQLYGPPREQGAAGGSRSLLGVAGPWLAAAAAAAATVDHPQPQWAYDLGTGLAYASCGLYLSSRLSQLYKNFKRRSAEGLALGMFLCAVAANTLYGASILLRSHSWAELASSLPWLVGSLGTVTLDAGILAQCVCYGVDKKHQSDEEEPLLPGTSRSRE